MFCYLLYTDFLRKLHTHVRMHQIKITDITVIIFWQVDMQIYQVEINSCHDDIKVYMYDKSIWLLFHKWSYVITRKNTTNVHSLVHFLPTGTHLNLTRKKLRSILYKREGMQLLCFSTLVGRKFSSIGV